MIHTIDGGVTAPKGYKASGVACGLKNNGEKDLAVVCLKTLQWLRGYLQPTLSRDTHCN